MFQQTHPYPSYPAPPAPQPPPRWFVGLDLGQSQDPTALAVLEQRRAALANPGKTRCEYLLHHVQRFELGTPYTDLVERVRNLLGRPARAGSNVVPLRGCIFGLDATGVGRPVVDMFKVARLPCCLCPVTITSGRNVSRADGFWHVPKADLVDIMKIVMQARRLLMDRALPLGELLQKELATFQTRITAAGNEQYGAWREGQHDDLVLAVAIAVWLAERGQPDVPTRPTYVPGMPDTQPRTGPRPNGFHL